MPHRLGSLTCRLVSVVPVTIAALGVAAGCAPTESSALSDDEYITEMETACTVTAAELAALAAPSDDAGRAEFALAAAGVIDDEAERVRDIEPPAASDADHRAFIANTEDQASRWREIGDVAPDDADELNRVSGEIARLTLGRDELAEEMDIPACRRNSS